MNLNQFNNPLLSSVMSFQTTFATASSTLIIDGTTKMIAAKFRPATLSPITNVRFAMNRTGTVTGINFKAGIYSDNGDIPNALLGGASPEFAGLAASGWIADQALSSNTGNLNINSSYWFVVWYSSGTNPDSSNFISFRTANAVSLGFGSKYRQYNGSDWTTTTFASTPCAMYVTHADGTITGMPLKTNTATTWATHIFGNNRQAYKERYSAPVRCHGVNIYMTKSGTPSDAELCLYEGSTLKHVETIGQASWGSSPFIPVYFTNGSNVLEPQILPANTDIYYVVRQNGDGGDNSNDFSLSCHEIIADICYSTNQGMCYGTGDDPTSYTVTKTFMPAIVPILSSWNSDLLGGSGTVITTNIAAPVKTDATYDNTKIELQRGNTEFSLKGSYGNIQTGSFNNNSGAWTDNSIRVAIPASALSISGNRVKVTLRSGSSTEGFHFHACYIGHSNTAPNFDGNQVPVLFSGNAYGTVPANSTLQSDEVVFALDETKELIIALDSGNDTSNDILRVNTSATGYNLYYKASVSEASQTTVVGYTNTANRMDGIASIDSYYDTSSPTVAPIFQVDSGCVSTIWDMSALDINENLASETGSIKYQYSCSATTTPSYNGSWLTLTELKAIADPMGRYMIIQAQFISDGTQDASVADSYFPATFPSGGGLGCTNFRGGFVNG